MLKEEYRFKTKELPQITPITWGQHSCEAGFFVDVVRPYWLLHYVVSGHGRFEKGGMVYSVSPSQIFVIRPHETQKYTADEKDPWHYIWIAFESDYPLPEILNCDVFFAPMAGRIFSDFLMAKQIEFEDAEFILSKLFELMGLLRGLESVQKERQNPYVAKAKDYIFKNIDKGIKVSDIAKELKLDRTYFSTLFKKECGLSPKQYLEKCSLERAAELLVSSESSVSEAAEAVGYTDIVNFSRMFKKHFGIPPSKYREMIFLHESILN